MSASVMSDRELQERFGLSSQKLAAWEADASRGVFHGEPRGEVVAGRPLKFGEEMAQVGFKETVSKIEAINRRASALGMSRSDYLRQLVDRDLASA